MSTFIRKYWLATIFLLGTLAAWTTAGVILYSGLTEIKAVLASFCYIMMLIFSACSGFAYSMEKRV